MDELRHRAQALLDRPPVPATPVVELRRRARRRRARRNATAAVATVVAVGCVAAGLARIADGHTTSHVEVEPTTPLFTGPVGWPETFVSTRVDESPAAVTYTVAISDARTGRAIRTLYTLPPDGTRVSGTGIGPDGNIWITVNRGPKLLGHTFDGNPQPHTCASTVVTVDPRTGARRTVFTGGDDELLTDAQPSPDGHRVAYLHDGCAAKRIVETLEVRQLGSGQVTDLHVSSTPCNFLFDPRWTADGRGLAFGSADPDQGCSATGAAKLAVVSAQTGQSTARVVTAPAAPNCSVAAVTTTRDGYASVEQCHGPYSSQFPAPLYINGPVYLARYDHTFKTISRVALGQCGDGASIAGTSRASAVIVSNYQFCPGGVSSTPATKLFVDDAAGLRLITTMHVSETGIDQLSF